MSSLLLWRHLVCSSVLRPTTCGLSTAGRYGERRPVCLGSCGSTLWGERGSLHPPFCEDVDCLRRAELREHSFPAHFPRHVSERSRARDSRPLPQVHLALSTCRALLRAPSCHVLDWSGGRCPRGRESEPSSRKAGVRAPYLIRDSTLYRPTHHFESHCSSDLQGSSIQVTLFFNCVLIWKTVKSGLCGEGQPGWCPSQGCFPKKYKTSGHPGGG